MGIAFFDIDKTLIKINSAKLWVRYELERGTLSRRDAARGMMWMGLYGLGATRIERAIKTVVADLKGRHEAPLIQDVAAFYDAHVRDTVRPGALPVLAHHRDVGDPIILITSSSNYIAELVCEQLGCDGYASNSFPTDAQGVFTGEVNEPLCFGAGKVWHAREWANKLGTTMHGSTFYTDSYSDLPLLKMVRHPRIVHPDPRLMREARRQHWDVLDWDKPVE